MSLTLKDAKVGETYIIKDVVTNDEEMSTFLFRLGCYSGEPITVISQKGSGCTASIKDGRYNLDSGIANAILI